MTIPSREIHPSYDTVAHRRRDDITITLVGYLQRAAISSGPAATSRPLAFRAVAGRTRVASIGERPRVQNHCTPRRIEIIALKSKCERSRDVGTIRLTHRLPSCALLHACESGAATRKRRRTSRCGAARCIKSLNQLMNAHTNMYILLYYKTIKFNDKIFICLCVYICFYI